MLLSQVPSFSSLLIELYIPKYFIAHAAILESAFAADPGRAYAELAHFDYIFDNQKDKALKKFWNSGLKAVPRANPG